MANGETRLGATQSGWLANAATALFIAVVAGVIVWWLTKPESHQPDLSYEVIKTGDFKKEAGRLNFFTVQLANGGSNVANGVTLNFRASNSFASIEETAVTTSPTRPKVTLKAIGAQRLLVVPQLKPTEKINVSFAVKSQEDVDLQVFGAAENANLERISPSDKEGLRDNPFILFLIVSAALGGNAVAVAILRKRIANRIRPAYAFADKNNIAFLMLHSGFPALAKDLLIKSFGTRYGEIALSNYALACAIEGDFECANSLAGTLNQWTDKLSPHSANVHRLNNDIIHALSGDKSAQDRLTSVLNGGSEFAAYLRNSFVLRKRLPELYEDTGESAT